MFNYLFFLKNNITCCKPRIAMCLNYADSINQSMLGFNETLQALMIALYIAMDSFGTACNVTGDGAIAVVVDKIAGKDNPSQNSKVQA